VAASSLLRPLVGGEGVERGAYASVHFRTEKWPFEAATSAACWAQVGHGLTLAMKHHGLTSLFIGSDVGHSVSYGGGGKALVGGLQQGKGGLQGTVARHLREQVVQPLESSGFTVFVGSEAYCNGGSAGKRKRRDGSGSGNVVSDTSAECATVDQIVMAKAKVFLHMYGHAPSACAGATSGSCYGQWILRQRGWKELPSERLAAFLPKVDQGPVVAHRGGGGGDTFTDGTRVQAVREGGEVSMRGVMRGPGGGGKGGAGGKRRPGVGKGLSAEAEAEGALNKASERGGLYSTKNGHDHGNP